MEASLDTLWVAGVGGFVLVAALIPLALRAWAALGRRDDEVSLRKVHTGQIPRVGGVVIMFGFGVMLLAGLAGVTELSATHELVSLSPLTGGLLGALLVGLTGLYDDLVGLRPRSKLAWQVVAALLAVVYGLHWPALELLLGWKYHWLATGLTVVFLVAAVNAVNMMDGLDGLAGGICLIGFGVVTLATVAHGAAVTSTDLAVGWISTCAVGAVAGFLLHNRHPAKVFMGDAGSYFMGFLLPVLLIQVQPVRWRVPEIQLSIAILPLTLPLFDMTLAVVRRLLRGQPIASGDSDHVHHRLLAAGLSHGRAVMVMWASSFMFSALAYLNVVGIGGWWTLLGTLVAAIAAAIMLGYHRMLARLPAFTGERFLGWRDRRREVMELLDAIESIRRSGDDRGPPRWRRVGPELAELLGRLGIPALQIRQADTIVIATGDARDAWAWLGLPLPGHEGAELRLALAVRLPELQQERLMLLEQAVHAVAGGEFRSRQAAADPIGSDKSTDSSEPPGLSDHAPS